MPTTTRLGFRNRPIHPDFAVSQQISKSLRTGRSYQRQHISLNGNYYLPSALIAAGAFTDYSIVPLMPGDIVVSAMLLVTLADSSGGASTYDAEVNGTLRGANLGGPWPVNAAASTPNWINIKPYATSAAVAGVAQLFTRIKNTGANQLNVQFQLHVVVLR